jgi:hypothetical protein
MCIIIPFNLLGQGKNTASANIHISIVKALQISQVQGNLTFADLVQTGVSTSIGRTPDKGILFEVNGNSGRNITLDFENTTLNNVTGNKSLNFIPEVSQTKNNTSYINPTPVLNGSSHKLEDINGTGYLYVWVGGKMDVDRNLPVGDYSGEFSVTVSY